MSASVCTMQKIGLLTFDGYPDLSPDDQLLFAQLSEQNIPYEIVNWNQVQPQDIRCTHLWIRSPWDYYLHIERFLSFLSECKNQGIELINSLPVIQWNYKKEYLFDIEKWGCPIVPSMIARDVQELESLQASLRDKKWTRVVLKPTVSGSSFKTYLCDTDSADFKEKALDVLSTHSLLVQPYLQSIQTLGELSLIYFSNGKECTYSHSVIKQPKDKDFRVQTEFGGSTEPFAITKPLDELSRKLLKNISHPWLYARVDVVDWENQPLISELEMIEPALYLKHHLDASANACRALKKYLLQ